MSRPAALPTLPCCELLAAHRILLAGDYLTVEVTTSGEGNAHRHGIRGTRTQWRLLAQRLMLATSAESPGDRRQETGDRPILKPAGHLL